MTGALIAGMAGRDALMDRCRCPSPPSAPSAIRAAKETRTAAKNAVAPGFHPATRGLPDASWFDAIAVFLSMK
jgi:hypothetical protein